MKEFTMIHTVKKTAFNFFVFLFIRFGLYLECLGPSLADSW